MKNLFILNHQPYDGTDITWNAIRLIETLRKKGEIVRVFLMNDAVDLARDSTMKPDFYEYNLVDMLKKLYDSGVELKVCGTCMARCGLNKNQPYFNDDIKGTMDALADWVIESDKVLTF
ncbi:MAG: DsrE family protein [Sulfurovaceae bacterium]